MSKLKYLIDGKADEQFEKMLWCFGGGDNDDSGGGGGGSDDYDEDDFVDDSGNIRQEFQDGGAGQRAVEANIERNRAQDRDQRDQVNAMQQQRATEEAISNVTQALFPTQPNEVQIAAAAAMTPAQRAAASAANDAMFNEFIANDIMNQRMDAAINPQVQVFDMNDPAGDYMLNPSLALGGNPADISVGAPNLPSRFITDASGTTFDTITGEIVDSTSDASYFGDLGGTSESTASGLTAGQQAAADRLTGMARTPSGQAASNYMGNITDAIGDQSRFVNRRFRDAANAGAILRPNFNASGQLDGFAANTGPFGSFVYTGTNNPNASADTSSDDTVPPQTNPLTGAQQCPDGYIFDDFLQACRPMTRSEKGINTGGTGTSSDMFYRQTALDTAPTNLPSGFDFDAANRRFTQSYAYRPDFYRSPMSLTGFTRVS